MGVGCQDLNSFYVRDGRGGIPGKTNRDGAKMRPAAAQKRPQKLFYQEETKQRRQTGRKLHLPALALYFAPGRCVGCSRISSNPPRPDVNAGLPEFRERLPTVNGRLRGVNPAAREVSGAGRELSQASGEVSRPGREVSGPSGEVSAAFREVSETGREVSRASRTVSEARREGPVNWSAQSSAWL